MVGLRIVALFVAALLFGCAGAGIVETDDPNTKLSQAQQLTNSGRAAQARRQLDEAIATFQANGDDLGLARSYRQYAILAELGGTDPGVVLLRTPVQNRIPTQADTELAKQYLQQAAELLTKQKKYDELSNIYLRLGGASEFLVRNYGLADKRAEACAYYDRSLQAHRDAEIQQPGLVVSLPRGVRSFSEFIARVKSEVGCA